MEDDDDFTFPTVATAALETAPPEGQLGHGDGDLLLQLPLPDLPTAVSPLWPFVASPKANVPSPPPVNKDQEAPPVSGTTGRSEHRVEAGDHHHEAPRGVAVADEERMDMLWEAAAATTTKPPAPRSAGSGATRHAEPPLPNPKPRRAEANNDGGDKQRDAERMDKLWESFNEELLLLRRARSKSAAAGGDRSGGGKAARRHGLDSADDQWFLCSSYSPSDDAGSEEEDTSLASSSPAEYGCAPTMLRASSRAGGAGQFCGGGSPRGGRRRGGRGAAAGWALLLRLFRRLFAVDKAAAESRGHATIYVP